MLRYAKRLSFAFQGVSTAFATLQPSSSLGAEGKAPPFTALRLFVSKRGLCTFLLHGFWAATESLGGSRARSVGGHQKPADRHGTAPRPALLASFLCRAAAAEKNDGSPVLERPPPPQACDASCVPRVFGGEGLRAPV